MNAKEFLKNYKIYDWEFIYNSQGKMVKTIGTLLEEYAAIKVAEAIIVIELGKQKINPCYGNCNTCDNAKPDEFPTKLL